MMLFKLFLYTHILAGMLALLSGGLSFATPKGRPLHRRSGQLYVLSMLAVSGTAFVICLLHYNAFLFVIAIFSCYMTLTGYRCLQLPAKVSPAALRPDWILWVTTLLLAAGFSAYLLLYHSLGSMQLVLFVFMGILGFLLVLDWKTLRNPETLTKPKRLKRHITRMGGAYISTLTAFVVTNVHTDPAYLGWLLPGLLMTPIVIRFVRRYSPKTKTVRQAA
jgi:uncharacterized membrane protein